MASGVGVCALLAALAARAAGNAAYEATTGKPRGPGRCQFVHEPPTPGFFWDTTCKIGMKGCLGDGRNVECRFCGEGDYVDIACPPESCRFPNEPFVSYYWDPVCEMGMVGCWADGVHRQCRFCGDGPFTKVHCPEVAGGRSEVERAEQQPTKDMKERKACTFRNKPKMPYFWDESCKEGMLGCLADGVHEECRFCAHRPFESIPCPEDVAPADGRCTFPHNSRPTERFFWDDTCAMGILGCWADGIHQECRYCGGVGVYANVTCPTEEVEESPPYIAKGAGPGGHVDEDEAAKEQPPPASHGKSGEVPAVKQQEKAGASPMSFASDLRLAQTDATATIDLSRAAPGGFELACLCVVLSALRPQ